MTDSNFDLKVRNFIKICVKDGLFDADTKEDLVFNKIRPMLVNAGFNQTDTSTGTGTASTSSTLSFSLKPKKSVSSASSSGEPKKLSGYNLFTRITSDVYKENNTPIPTYSISGLWKTFEHKDKFNEVVKNDTISTSTDYLKSLIEIKPIDNSFVPNYSWYLKVVKALNDKNVTHDKKKWSELSKEQRDEFFEKYAEYIPNN